MPNLEFQAYILNLPIGHTVSNVARDTVKLGDFEWTPNEYSKRKICAESQKDR